jgi:hypothetical protein
MAGDWIKMRASLQTHPKVVRIASALKTDRLRVVGGLHAVWCLFDEHSEDGFLCGYTPSAVDDLLGFPGFAEALIGIGWLASDGNDGLTLPEFDTHNGASAKRRAQENDRKRAERAATKEHPKDDRNMSASKADEKRTREEKRREENKKPPKSPKGEPPGFAEWYAAYPKKQARPSAAKAFAKVTESLPVLLAALEWQRRQFDWTKEGGKYIPLPATYLNNERWNDERGEQAAETEWHQSRSGVEGKARELGLRPWIEVEEQWPTFRRRVMQAVKDLAAPAISFEQLQQAAAQRQGAH